VGNGMFIGVGINVGVGVGIRVQYAVVASGKGELDVSSTVCGASVTRSYQCPSQLFLHYSTRGIPYLSSDTRKASAENSSLGEDMPSAPNGLPDGVRYEQQLPPRAVFPVRG